MTSIPGVDYAWSHPGGAALKAAGKQFAARYLSHDAAKNLTKAEAADLAAHGIWAVVVWETTANRAGSGRAAGIADAKEAAAQAAAAGAPASRPIYFAVDYDANPPTVDGYFQGVVSVLGAARTGVYGGFRVVKHLLDGGLAHWAWQTRAWSGGQWDSRAVIRQGAQADIGGVSVDLDTATAADYGQWQPGVTPNHPAPKPPAPKPVPHVPFPGAAWFHAGRKSPVVAAMHKRLVAVGCNRYQTSKNADVIGSGDVASYEAWQRKYNAAHHKGWTGAALKWPPGKETWDALQVPR